MSEVQSFMKPSRRALAGRLLALSFFLFTLLTSASVFAQLATRHYLPPVVAYSDSDIEIQVSTPSGTPANYTIRSASGGLFSANMSLPAISDSVTAGAPDVHTFTRAGNNANASGGLGRTLSTSPAAQDDYGIIVESDVAVSVIMSALRENNRSIIASKGDNAVGTDFYAWSALNTTNIASSADNDSVHFVSIMALEDGTNVTVAGDDIFAGFDPGVDNPILLDAFQTITLSTRNNQNLSGTRITSSSPIAVVSGDAHPQQPIENERDGAVDQLIPNSLAGTHYAIGNIEDSRSFGVAGEGGVPLGNRYVQLIALADNTVVEHYRTDGTAVAQYTLTSAGDVSAVYLSGDAGDGHYFSSVGAGTEPFLLFLNSSGEPGDEMGGAAVPALRGKDSGGSFCSGVRYVEFTAPNDVTNFMVYIPTDDLGSLRIDRGTGFEDYDDPSMVAPTSVTAIDPDGAGGVEELTFFRFPGTLVPAGNRVAFESTGRMHVAVGTAVSGRTASFGYFSDYNLGFSVQDPVLGVPTDSYVEPQTFADATPRAINHCVQVDSSCSRLFSITSLSSDRGGSFESVTTNAMVEDAPPCFDFTPVPVPGAGPQQYVVSATIEDEVGAVRDVDIFFTFTWLDDEDDGIPDAIDLDDDNDGIVDSVELGGVDLSGDADLDQVSDYEDPSFVSCESTDGIRCDAIPVEFDPDGDGIPNHLDPDSDGDGVLDFVEGNDTNQDGQNDHGSVADVNADGAIDTMVDTDENGVHDDFDDEPAATQDSDGDGIADFLDPDDDNDGILTVFEDYDGNGPVNDDTDGDGTPDYLDPDDDGDGSPTINEFPDPNGDGDPSDAIDEDGEDGPDYLDPGTVGVIDTDGDGVPDLGDDDDDNDGILDTIEGTVDTDGDGLPDARDVDSDNDGIPDIAEIGLGALDADGDGRIDEVADEDGDGVPDGLEDVADILDTDGDGIADYLDLDADADGVLDVREGGGVDSNGDGRLDSDVDEDGDGLMDVADSDEGGTPLPVPDTDGDGTPDFQDLDADADGVSDSTEGHDNDGDGVADSSRTGEDSDADGIDDGFDPDAGGSSSEPPDRDGDGVPDFQDVDDDGDGVDTVDEDVDEDGDPTNDDSDGDGTPDYLDTDDDGDGVLTVEEEPRGDSDGDGTPDYLDTDDDGDGIPTEQERGDADGDGTPDYLEGPGSGASLLGGGFTCSTGTPAGPWSPGAFFALLGLGLALIRRRHSAD